MKAKHDRGDGNIEEVTRIAIIGAGAWGSTLASLVIRAGHQCGLISQSGERAEFLRKDRRVPGHPGHFLDRKIEISDSLTALSFQPQAIFVVLAVQKTRKFLESFQPPADLVAIIFCNKGLDLKTALTPYQLASEIFSRRHQDQKSRDGEAGSGASAISGRLAVLSGPNFAGEILAGQPAATVIAADNSGIAERLARALASDRFRPYLSDDPVGVSLCGAIKNCLALASGIVEGANLGENVRAALVTRAINEFRRWFPVFGASPATLYGLAGLGDILLSCSSSQSRNFSYGVRLARGEPASQGLAEGVDTFGAVCSYIRESQKRVRIEAPLLFTIEDIIRGRVKIDDAITRLFSRKLVSE